MNDESHYRELAEKLQQTLDEKNALLKEIYHRVKNNLQVISGLLILQIQATSDPQAQKVLMETETRVKAMSLIHEMLYSSENLSTIEMAEYINNLFDYLYKIYEITPSISYTIHVEPIILNVEKAIPMGLLLNELITNTFKYAFPNNKFGNVQISLKRQNQQLLLVVSDDGVGIPENIDIQRTNSLGMQLIVNLTKQLKGDLVLDRSNGTAFAFTFPEE